MELSRYPSHFCQLQNLKYAYIREGSGMPIILLHGFPDHAGGWDDIISVLSKSHCCIAPFLRGYYPTAIPIDKNYSLLEIAKDIHQLANLQGFKEYHIAGVDWGASIAYIMANLYPQEIRSILTIGMPHPSFLKPSLKLLIKARHVMYLANSKKGQKRLSKNNYGYLETLYTRWAPGLDWKKLKEQIVYCFNTKGYKEGALGYYSALFKDGKRKERILLYNRLPEMPVTVLVGKKDGAIDLSQFEKMEKHRCFAVKYHENGGHFLHREDPAYCIQHIKTLQ